LGGDEEEAEAEEAEDEADEEATAQHNVEELHMVVDRCTVMVLLTVNNSAIGWSNR
tara:strand:+ start:478 stop:645 length:168 start_codon:yes stop_codon:yes gene_type:complete